MFLLYLVYGAAFFATGILLAFQARLPESVVPRAAFRWFACFAVLHGLAEWAKLVATMSGTVDIAQARLAALVLAILSFAVLAQFGFAVLRIHREWPRWSLAIPALLVLGWLATVAAVARTAGLGLEELEDLEAVGRYALALPASLLAAGALWSLRRGRPERDSIGRYLGWASGIFVAYALVAGVIVTPASFFPASLINRDTFVAVTHVPIEVLRMSCAIGLAVMLSRALVIEVDRRHREHERRREEFISVVAHDLRSPINTIHLSTGLLLERIGAFADGDRQLAAKLLRHIQTGASALERMVRDLLDASRIETHMLSLEPRALDTRSLIAGVVERATEATKGHVVKVVLPETLPEVLADPMRVEQILVNLLSNAAKYSAPNTEITVDVTEHGSELEIAVTNHGHGLSPDEIANVFSRFYRSKAHSRIEGLGLGLYIARGLVEAQGGRIWVDSKLGSYATFRFTLPRGPTRDAARDGRDHAAAGARTIVARA